MKPFSNTAIKINFYLLLLLLLLPGTIIAQNIKEPSVYKSIDKEGKVIYSATPARNAEQSSRMNIPPPPSEKGIRAAQKRQAEIKKAAEILDENRKKHDAIITEENRLKREKQKQQQLQRQAEKNNENQNNHPYIPIRRPGGTLPPAHRPIQLPSRPSAH